MYVTLHLNIECVFANVTPFCLLFHTFRFTAYDLFLIPSWLPCAFFAARIKGLPWAFAGWLDPEATADKPAKNAFADPELTANYTLAWLKAAKRIHDLDIDYIGQW